MIQSKNVHKNYVKYVVNQRIENTKNKDDFIALKGFMDKKFHDTFKN